jgi:hypothetical protein
MMVIASSDQLVRLDSIAEHLELQRRSGEPGFEEDAVQACVSRLAPIIRKANPKTGEEIAAVLAAHFSVHFEEVRGPDDIDLLEKNYLRQKRELGFGRLREELEDPHVDALLFRRMRAQPHEPDKWVAVLNLQLTDAKAYWDRFHEITHRAAEPAQRVLPFRRHRVERRSPVERLIDTIAGEFAFYAPLFRPLVRAAQRNYRLTFAAVESLQNTYAPSSSLLATTNAVVKYWPSPAMVVTASMKGRKSAPEKDRALRVGMQTRSSTAKEAHLSCFPNMRVPMSSPIFVAFAEKRKVEGLENLGAWTTSTGESLAAIQVFTAAICLGNVVYGLISAQ